MPTVPRVAAGGRRGSGAGEVTTKRLGRKERAADSGRSWNLALLAETERGRRNRRTIDAAFLAMAAIVIGLTAVVARSAPAHDDETSHRR